MGQVIEVSNPFLEHDRSALDAYFVSQDVDFSSLTLADAGTDFQKRVWNYLSQIPKGQTTYGQIARDLMLLLLKRSRSCCSESIFIIIPLPSRFGKSRTNDGYAGI